MAKLTPEGKVKKKIIDFLKKHPEEIWFYMPVQNGMGQTGIPDIMVTIKGRTLGIETKANSKAQPTTLQAFQLDKLKKAGGVAWLVDDTNTDLAIANITQALENEHYSVGDNILSDSSLYRWKSKLEVMEFEGN